MKFDTAKAAHFRGDIQGLRAIAVLAVLFYHLKFQAFSGGFVGVDIFFVISGYLITRILWPKNSEAPKISLMQFLDRRISRLFPGLIFVVLLAGGLAFLFSSPADLIGISKSGLATIAGVSNFTFWAESGYFESGAYTKPLLHTWSLSLEIQFYILFGLIALLPPIRKMKVKGKIIFLCIAILGSLAASTLISSGLLDAPVWARSNWLGDRVPTAGYFLLPFRFYEFCLGGLVFCLERELRGKAMASIVQIIGLLMIGLSIFLYSKTTPFPSYTALLPTVGTALCIYAGRETILRFLLDNKISKYIGDISYSLYLVHWPLIVFTFLIFGDLTLTHKAIIIILTFILAALSYHFVEPLMKGGVKRLKGPRLAGFAVAGVAALFLVISPFVASGWPSRSDFPEGLTAAADRTEIYTKFYGGAGFPADGWIYGNNNPDLILMGDSHIRHYNRGMADLAAREGLSGVYVSTGPSCFLLPGLGKISPREKHDYDKICPQALEKTLELIRDNPDATVVMSHWWVSQLKTAGLLQANAETLPATENDIFSALKEFRTLIPNRIVIIGNVPTTRRGDLVGKIRATRLLKWLQPTSEDWKQAEIDPTVAAFNSKLKGTVNNLANTVFIDPTEALCEAGTCRNFIDDTGLLYSDSNHLSVIGSKYVVTQFQDDILAAMK